MFFSSVRKFSIRNRSANFLGEKREMKRKKGNMYTGIVKQGEGRKGATGANLQCTRTVLRARPAACTARHRPPPRAHCLAQFHARKRAVLAGGSTLELEHRLGTEVISRRFWFSASTMVAFVRRSGIAIRFEKERKRKNKKSKRKKKQGCRFPWNRVTPPAWITSSNCEILSYVSSKRLYFVKKSSITLKVVKNYIKV